MFKNGFFVLILALALIGASNPAWAGWAVNGDAYWEDLPGDSERVTLTDEVNDQAGSAWIETQIDLDQDFDISFRIHLGDNDGGGADGISFALQRDPTGTAAFGDTSGGGEWIGMNGICPSVSVEVDTYYNSGRNDITADHLGVNVYTSSGGVCSGVPNHAGAGPIQASPSATNIEDGSEHDLRITWDATNHYLDVYFDNMTTRRLRYTGDMVSTVFGGDSLVYFGFTASTGGAYNWQYIIPNTPAVSAGKNVDDSVILKNELPQNVQYTITIDNDGVVTGFGTQITDTLPAGFTYVNNSTSGATTANPSISYSGGRQVLLWDMSATPIPPNGGTMTISFQVQVTSSTPPGAFPNDFTVTGDNFDQIDETEMATVVIGPADLSVNKSHTGDYYVGQNGTFTLDVSNGGPDYAEDIMVADTLPAGLDYVGISGAGWSVASSSGQTYTWTHAGPLSNGASLPTLTVTVFANDTTGAAYPSVTNTATVSSTSPDLVPGNNSDSDAITVHPLADLEMTKSHTGDFGVGVNGVYSLVVTNNGPNIDPAATITVADTLPAGLAYVSSSGNGWTLASSSGQTYTWTHAGSLASGSSLPALSVTVLPDASAMPSVTNTATVSSPTNDDNLANNTDTDPTNVVEVVDLSISKSHSGDFVVGAPDNTYDIDIINNGPSNETNPIYVADTLPTGLGYTSFTGTGWSLASSSGQTYTWTHAGPLPAGNVLPTLTVTVSAAASAIPSVTNTATVSSASADANSANDSDSDVTTVRYPSVDLSISKNHTGAFTSGASGTWDIVVYNNGPDDDTTAIYVVDTLPTGINYSSFSGTGWTVASSSGQTYTWTHSGPLAAGTSLPALGVTVTPSTSAVPSVTNTATVTSSGNDSDPANNSDSDPTTVLGPTAGNKPLYLWGAGSQALNRDATATYLNYVAISGSGGSSTWTLNPTLSSSLTLASGAVHNVYLELGWNNTNWRNVRVILRAGGTEVGRAETGNWYSGWYTAPTTFQFSITGTSNITLNQGDAITLEIVNLSGRSNRQIYIYPRTGAPANYLYSYVDLNSSTVISVDSVNTYDDAYSGGAVTTQFYNNETVYVRTVISDPFGAYDITGAELDIIDANGVTRVSSASMTEEASTLGTKTYEYEYALPSTPLGTWTARVRAIEGDEGLVTDVDSATFTVIEAEPDIVALKTLLTIYDPVTLGTNPHAIPGAEIQYTVRVTNQGPGAVTTNTLELIDPIDIANTELFVGDIDGSGPLSGPVQFTCSSGTPPCGLTYTYTSLVSNTDDVDFSNNNGSTYTYVPTPDAYGCDSNVTHIRVRPKGQFSGAGAGYPYCDIVFKVRIK